MIVDDDDDVRIATHDAMERRGYDVVAVGSGAEALAYLTYETPDLILLDLHMDDMNGWEVLGALRDDSRFARTEVIVVTGSDAKVGHGVRVMRKPFKIDQLLAMLDTPRAA